MNKRSRPFKIKYGSGAYHWHGFIIKRQTNNLWGVWWNHKDKMSSDNKTLKDCMEVVEFYWKVKSKKHLRLVENA
jgi:hypothetical protein